jgi:hypothetical protein
MSEVLNQWKLRTHPFRPSIDPEGKPFPEVKQLVTKDFLLGTLDPKLDERFINFYYDFYGWSQDQLIYGISRGDKNLLKKFPKESDLKEPKSILIINQGLEGHGLKSLRNLILHKIRLEAGAEPILVKLKLDGRNHPENVKAVARNFRDSYEDAGQTQPTTEQLEKIYDQETAGPATGAQSAYQNLFTRTNERVRKFCQNPFVLLLECGVGSAGDSYDAWQVLYNSTSPLFQYIFVITTNLDNARTANAIFLRDEKNVAFIISRDLGLDDAREYLRAKLAGERAVPVQEVESLIPFTEKALEELFLPGQAAIEQAGAPDPGQAPAAAKKIEERRFKIFELNRTFVYAFDYLANLIEQQQQPKNALIGPETISAVRDLINQGANRPIPKTV